MAPSVWPRSLGFRFCVATALRVVRTYHLHDSVPNMWRMGLYFALFRTCPPVVGEKQSELLETQIQVSVQ